ncbi:MAG: hypothetical protein ACE5I1_19775 [bacterium]
MAQIPNDNVSSQALAAFPQKRRWPFIAFFWLFIILLSISSSLLHPT